jgi:pre-mRNA cleavage complex 2 protein Pcf11
MISILYSGSQCGSCGVRFPEEQKAKYSDHLDWHFRTNRRGKDGARTIIQARKWYYDAKNWLQFQEMEDKSDRGRCSFLRYDCTGISRFSPFSDVGVSWFDNHPLAELEKEVEEVPCVKANPTGQDCCELCRDKFEQFFCEENEEWQLRNAIKVDDKYYHPICHKDHKV